MPTDEEPAGPVFLSWAGHVSGASRQDVEDMFFRLREEAAGSPPPTAREVAAFYQKTAALIAQDGTLGRSVRQSMLRRVARAEAEAGLVSGAAWHALSSLIPALRDQEAEREAAVEQAASCLGMDQDRVRQDLRRRREKARRVPMLTAQGTVLGCGCPLPADRIEAYAVNELHKAAGGSPSFSGPPPVPRFLVTQVQPGQRVSWNVPDLFGGGRGSGTVRAVRPEDRVSRRIGPEIEIDDDAGGTTVIRAGWLTGHG